MARSEILGGFEHVVLLAITRINAEAESAEKEGKVGAWAYGVSIEEEIEDRTGKLVSSGAVYGALVRLEAKGFAESWIGEPERVAGGRGKKFYRVTRNGRLALAEARNVYEVMWEGIAPEGSLA